MSLVTVVKITCLHRTFVRMQSERERQKTILMYHLESGKNILTVFFKANMSGKYNYPVADLGGRIGRTCVPLVGTKFPINVKSLGAPLDLSSGSNTAIQQPDLVALRPPRGEGGGVGSVKLISTHHTHPVSLEQFHHKSMGMFS